MILYYSCSGSSEHVANELAKEMKENAICINHDVNNREEGYFRSSTPFVIVCPIFNMRVPLLVSEFLQKAKFEGSNEVVFVAVCSYSSGNARGYLNSIFKAKGMKMFYTVVIMPSTNAFKTNTTSEKSREKIIERADKETLRLAYVITHNSPIVQASVSLVGLIGSALNPLIVKTHSDKKLIANSNCTKCGKCIDGCPTKNIVFTDKSVDFSGNCIHCSLCVNTCPEKAITVGKNK